MAKISKKGLAVTFDTSGYTQFASNMMLQNAQQEVKYIQDFVQNQRQLRKTLSDNYSIAPNGVHALGLEHFDKIASEGYSQVMKKAMSGPITNQDIAEFTASLSREKQAINGGISAEAELIKQAPKEMDANRIQDVLADIRRQTYSTGKPQDYIKLLDGINLTEMDGSSYLINENSAGKTFIDGFGELKRSTYGDTSQVSVSMSNVFDPSTRKLRKDASGYVAKDIYELASSDALMNRVMDDEVLKVAYIKSTGSMDGYDDVRESMLTSGVLPESIAKEFISIQPQEREQIRKKALERVLTNVADGTYQVTPLAASQAKGTILTANNGIRIRKGAGDAILTSSPIGVIAAPGGAKRQTLSASVKGVATVQDEAGDVSNVSIKGYSFTNDGQLLITGDRLVGGSANDIALLGQLLAKGENIRTQEEKDQIRSLQSKVKQQATGKLETVQSPEVVASEILQAITGGINYNYPSGVSTDIEKLRYLWNKTQLGNLNADAFK